MITLLVGIFCLMLGGCLGVLAASLSKAAHEEVPSRVLIGVCPDCGHGVLEGDELVVRHVDCPTLELVGKAEA